MSLTKVSFSMIDGAVSNVLDFGALGDGTGTVVGSSVNTAPWNVWPSEINGSTYGTKPGHDYGDATWLAANKPFQATDTLDFIGIQLAMWSGKNVYLPQGIYVINRSLRAVCQFYGNIFGDHNVLSTIEMKNRDAFPTLSSNGSPVANIGKPLLYFYRTGLSGMTVSNLGFRTTIVSGFNGDANTIISNLATSTSCIAMTNADSVQIRNVFLSGTGEIGVNLYDQCAITIDSLTTEYYSAHIFMQAGCSITITNSNIYNSWRNTDLGKRVAGILMYGPNAVVKCYTTNFWEMYYGAIYSESATNSLLFHENAVTNANNPTIPTDGTGYLMYLSQFGSGTSGIGSYDIQNNSFLFGNNDYAPLVLISTYPSILSGNDIGTTTEVTWGVAQITGSNVLIEGNKFDVTQVALPSVNGNIIYSAASFPYDAGSSNVLFATNLIKNQSTRKVALKGVLLGNYDNSVSGSLAMSSGVTSGTYYSLVAPDTLSTGTYLVEVVWEGSGTPNGVSASGTMRIGLQQSTSNGPAVPISIVDYTNTSKTLTIVPYGDVTGNAAGIKVATNFNYVGTDSNFSYRFVRMI